MPKDFIPKNNAELLVWAQHNSAIITATPTAFGLTAPIATAYAALVASFDTAVAAATGDTRSRVDVLECNAVKQNLVASIRSWARLAQAHPGITTAQRAELGISLRDNPGTPINAPTVKPVLEILAADGRSFKMRITALGKEGRAKEDGTSGAIVFSYVGAAPNPNPDAWVLQGSVTRSSFTVELPLSVAPGAQVWFRAAWYSQRGLYGPLSTAVSAYVAGSLGSIAPATLPTETSDSPTGDTTPSLLKAA